MVQRSPNHSMFLARELKTPPNRAVFESPPLNHTLFSLEIPREEELTQADRLRLWRHDALMQHHYKTAEFVGDKVLALTQDPVDAFWLAQVYATSGNYLRATHLLNKPQYSSSLSCRYVAGWCYVKLERWDDAFDWIGESNQVKKDTTDSGITPGNATGLPLPAGGIKLEASMCYLRGLIYANQNNFERAKECYKEAVLIDLKCFEAFNELISNNLLTPAEEWELVSSLNYRDAGENDELVRALYTSRVSKYLAGNKFEAIGTLLKDEFDLGDNCDILASKAENLFVQCNFDECLKVCEKILNDDPFNFEVIRTYLSSLHELGAKNKLFLLAHKIAENYPTNPIGLLAIGIYYLAIGKIAEARKFFSKATLLNPNFGQAWIGFAHTFAAEGEHEQAISAYAFAARLFPGTHLPNLFLGMQYLHMNNIKLSEEYLMASYQICRTDPLLLNEIGVINFHKNELPRAELFLQEALVSASYMNSDSKTWISIHANLGHVYRRAGQFQKLLECFSQVLRVSSKNDANILAAMGLVYMKTGQFTKAIDMLHDALAVAPSDNVATDLLKRALEMNCNYSHLFFDGIDQQLPTQLAAALKEGESDEEIMEIEVS